MRKSLVTRLESRNSRSPRQIGPEFPYLGLPSDSVWIPTVVICVSGRRRSVGIRFGSAVARQRDQIERQEYHDGSEARLHLASGFAPVSTAARLIPRGDEIRRPGYAWLTTARPTSAASQSDFTISGINSVRVVLWHHPS